MQTRNDELFFNDIVGIDASSVDVLWPGTERVKLLGFAEDVSKDLADVMITRWYFSITGAMRWEFSQEAPIYSQPMFKCL